MRSLSVTQKEDENPSPPQVLSPKFFNRPTNNLGNAGFPYTYETGIALKDQIHFRILVTLLH
jgi:hypothetical protein